MIFTDKHGDTMLTPWASFHDDGVPFARVYDDCTTKFSMQAITADSWPEDTARAFFNSSTTPNATVVLLRKDFFDNALISFGPLALACYSKYSRFASRTSAMAMAFWFGLCTVYLGCSAVRLQKGRRRVKCR